MLRICSFCSTWIAVAFCESFFILQVDQTLLQFLGDKNEGTPELGSSLSRRKASIGVKNAGEFGLFSALFECPL